MCSHHCLGNGYTPGSEREGGSHPLVSQALIAQHRPSTVLWEGPSHDDVWDLSVPLGRICVKVAAGPQELTCHNIGPPPTSFLLCTRRNVFLQTWLERHRRLNIIYKTLGKCIVL